MTLPLPNLGLKIMIITKSVTFYKVHADSHWHAYYRKISLSKKNKQGNCKEKHSIDKNIGNWYILTTTWKMNYRLNNDDYFLDIAALAWNNICAKYWYDALAENTTTIIRWRVLQKMIISHHQKTTSDRGFSHVIDIFLIKDEILKTTSSQEKNDFLGLRWIYLSSAEGD